MINKQQLTWNSPQNEILVLSPTAEIVTRLLNNENGEMLNRICIKLGISSEEIYQLVAEM